MLLHMGFPLLFACALAMQVVAAVAAESINLRLDPGYAKGQRYDLQYSFKRDADSQTYMGKSKFPPDKVDQSKSLNAVLVVKQVTASAQLSEFDLLISSFESTDGDKTTKIVPDQSKVTLHLTDGVAARIELNGKLLDDNAIQLALLEFLDNCPMLRESLDATMGREQPVKVGDVWDPGVPRVRAILGQSSQSLDAQPAKSKRAAVLKDLPEADGETTSRVQLTVTNDLAGVVIEGAKIDTGAFKAQYEFVQPLPGSNGARSTRSLIQAVIKIVNKGSKDFPIETTTNSKVKDSAEIRMQLRADGAPALAAEAWPAPPVFKARPAAARPKPAGPRSKPAAEKEEADGGDNEVPPGWD